MSRYRSALDKFLKKDTFVVFNDGFMNRKGHVKEDTSMEHPPDMKDNDEIDKYMNSLVIPITFHNDSGKLDHRNTNIYEIIMALPSTLSPSEQLLHLARSQMKLLTFRLKKRIMTKESWYDQNLVYYGFTKSHGMFHFEQYDYPHVYNNSRCFDLNSSLYYQNGDYCNFRAREGILQFDTVTYGHYNPGEVGDIMCGEAQKADRGHRFIKWFYCGMPFYYLWLLIMFGPEWYVFRGLTKEQILERLYEPRYEGDGFDGFTNPRIWQVYARVIYYGESPDSAFDGQSDCELAKNIKKNLLDAISEKN